MDKSKSDKLKEVLNQTLSSEEIEKKLKNEMKQNAQKKIHKIQNEEIKILETKIEENKAEIPNEAITQKTIEKESKKNESPLNKKVDIPNIREKKRDSKNMNIVLYLVILIAILLLAIVIYLFISSNEPTIEEKKTKVEKEIVQKEAPDIKVDKEEVTDEKQVEPKVIIKEVIKEKIITKPVKLDNKSFKKFYNSPKFNTLKCYNFKAGNIFPNKTCKDSLGKFLKENIDAIRIEIVPVIAQSDYVVFKKLEENIKTLDKAYQDRVQEYMFRGLARERVLEITWQIKEILGKDTLLTPTNYYVKSQKENKGVIIKAYHH